MADETDQRLALLQTALALNADELYRRLSGEFHAADAVPPDPLADGRSRFRAFTQNLKRQICSSAVIKSFCMHISSSGPSALTAVMADQVLADLDRYFPGSGIGYAAKVYLAALIAKNGIETICAGIETA